MRVCVWCELLEDPPPSDSSPSKDTPPNSSKQFIAWELGIQILRTVGVILILTQQGDNIILIVINLNWAWWNPSVIPILGMLKAGGP